MVNHYFLGWEMVNWAEKRYKPFEAVSCHPTGV